MQPYFLPYIGYFQLIKGVDEFIIYDNIQYSRKGWIQRNRMLENEKDAYFSLSLKKDSDYLDVRERRLSDQWPQNKEKLLRRISANYRRAPFHSDIFPLIESIFNYENENLFKFIFYSVTEICNLLDIKTKITISSNLNIDHSLKSQEKVIALVKSIQGQIYLNPIGGLGLYNNQDFIDAGIKLEFHKAKPISYTQYKNEFIPWLSILDILMFNPVAQVKEWLEAYEIIEKNGEES